MATQQNRLALTPEFTRALGLFHAAHASLDLTTDFAIYKFLGVTPQQAHLITSGMMFGRKARLLADLIGRSDHENKKELLRTFNAVRGNNRDVIAHGYIWSDSKSVKFIERSISGEFKTIEHKFSLNEFVANLDDFNNKATAFYNAFSVTFEEINAFANAALNLNRKSKTPP
jgi:hypothetical protein